MKFQQKYEDANVTDRVEFENSYVTKDARLGHCCVCDALTKWLDGKIQKSVCSEECCSKFWNSLQGTGLNHNQLDLVQKMVAQEIALAKIADPVWKDIIVIVRDQLDYLKICIDSIREHTKYFNLYIWDNGSGPEMKKYLGDLQEEHFYTNPEDWDIEVWTVDENMGFIVPNNKLAALGTNDYIILLNSDTKVFECWDTAMISWLQNNSDVAQVGYWGGHLGPDGRGFGGDNGAEIDYVPGWCFCMSRETYKKHGLFDQDNLTFAYCEDADLSLRLKEAGRKIYALYAPLVLHYQNKTIKAVEKEGQIDVRATFDHNHEYIKRRWKDYLASGRIFAQKA